jgi:hypothetical protein
LVVGRQSESRQVGHIRSELNEREPLKWRGRYNRSAKNSAGGFPIDGFVHRPAELFVQFPSRFLVIDGDARGDCQHVLGYLDRHDQAAVEVAADDVAGADHRAAATDWCLRVDHFDAAGDDRAADAGARDGRALQDTSSVSRQ